MVKAQNVRTLQSAVFPPGPTHVHAVRTMCIFGENGLKDLIIAAGTSHSLVADFFVKTAGNEHITSSTFSRLPHIRDHELEDNLILRALRLNCVVSPYAPMWARLYRVQWQQDSWVPHIGVDYANRRPLGAIGPQWEWNTPLRCNADRRQALVEIDAIVAIMLGITAEELLTIYGAQFPVLQKYEREALYDANGRQLPGKLASEFRKGKAKPADFTVDGVTYVEPFAGVDRERDMKLAHKHFSDLAARLAESS